MADYLLQQFARSPRPGFVKTRLMVELDADAACRVHEELVEWTWRHLVASKLGAVEVWVEGAQDARVFREALAGGVGALFPQQGDDLGERMCRALQDGLERAGRVCLVGSDCPGIDCAYLEEAVSALHSHDLVFGPATDGGYVLIACRRTPDMALFEGVNWGSDVVLEQSLDRAKALGWDVALLAPLRDIDRPEDLSYWESIKAGAS